MCRYSSKIHDISADSLLLSMYKGVAGRMSYDQKSCKNRKAVLMPDKSCSYSLPFLPAAKRQGQVQLNVEKKIGTYGF